MSQSDNSLNIHIISGDKFQYISNINHETLFQDKSKDKILIHSFDLDYTLVTPKSKRKFSRSEDDWKFMDGVLEKLKENNRNDILTFIITNQNVKNKRLALNKCKNIFSELHGIGINLCMMVSLEDDNYRKPRIDGLMFILNTLKIDNAEYLNKMTYVGDAAGRSSDFSDSDYKFALNVNRYYACEFKTPETYFENKEPEYLATPKLYNKTIKENKEDVNALINTIFKFKEPDNLLICLIGAPASGKTHLRKSIENYTSACGLTTSYISQDELKTFAKCKKKALERSGDNIIIIDNTNGKPDTRNEWSRLADTMKYKILYIYLKNTKEESTYWLAYRNIQRIKSGESAMSKMSIIMFYKNLKEPDTKEVGDNLVTISNYVDRFVELNSEYKECMYY